MAVVRHIRPLEGSAEEVPRLVLLLEALHEAKLPELTALLVHVSWNVHWVWLSGLGQALESAVCSCHLSLSLDRLVYVCFGGCAMLRCMLRVRLTDQVNFNFLTLLRGLFTLFRL